MGYSLSGLVYSYTRFSDPRQAKGTSAERQAAYAARWAAEHGLRLDESLTLQDEGLSAYHQRHVKSGALGVFLAAVESGKVPAGSVLVVEGLDRLSRAEPIQAQAQLAQIVNAGITVVTASDGKAYSRERLKANPMDLVYSLLVMIRAHEESDTKSKRVKAAISKQCEGWLAGTFRGIVRNGKDPAWTRLVDGKFELVPERVEAVRTALDLYRRGYSPRRITMHLANEGLQMTDAGPQSLQIYRLIQQRALLGEKEIAVDGTTYRLPGYYPSLLTPAEWDDLQAVAHSRVRRVGKSVVPHLITGLRIAVCGYCGHAMVGQNIGTRNRRADGGIHDGHRRLNCITYKNADCTIKPMTISVAPIERALMTYCSDMLNLQALYGGDRSSGPRTRVAAARAKLAELTQQIERLTDAVLQAGADGGAPLAFARRARTLEAKQADAEKELSNAERELSALARVDLVGADAAWQSLAAGVEAQDYDARIRARQLVADTFQHIVIYRAGVRPSETPKGIVEILLMAKGGVGRLLRLNAKGELLAGEAIQQLLEYIAASAPAHAILGNE